MNKAEVRGKIKQIILSNPRDKNKMIDELLDEYAQQVCIKITKEAFIAGLDIYEMHMFLTNSTLTTKTKKDESRRIL